MNAKIKAYAKEFARLGGKSITSKKQAAARKNGRLGGRPKAVNVVKNSCSTKRVLDLDGKQKRQAVRVNFNKGPKVEGSQNHAHAS